VTDRPLAGRVDHAADGIVKRLHRRMRNVDHHEIGLGVRGDPPEIVAPQRAGAPNRRGGEHVG
jgi:hypothetical protein